MNLELKRLLEITHIDNLDELVCEGELKEFQNLIKSIDTKLENHNTLLRQWPLIKNQLGNLAVILENGT